MMTRQYIWNLLKHVVMAALLVLPLSGCPSLEWDSTDPAPTNVSDVAISGSVGDGPVIGATITVYSNSGEVLGSMTSDDAASFRATLKVRGNQYPLRLVVSGGIDLVTGMVPDFEMVSAMLHPSDKQVNINPFTTLIVMLAEKMPGGLSRSTVDAARPVILEQLGFGLDTNIISDPVTTEVTFENVAYLVKASEALGEMIRRTRDLIIATGKSASGDSVLVALSGDLTDGVIDGLGGAGANPIVASMANVVSGQVLVEAMSNNLRVSGMIATSIIDQSIVTTRHGIGNSQLTGSVAINAQIIDQARVAVAAARVLDAGSAVADISARITSLAPGSLPDEVATVLPTDSTLALENAVQLVATATSEDVAAINQVVASGGSSTPAPLPTSNTPPVISGSPASTVTAGDSYQFQPAASDADGDPLSFSITNKPSWASFDAGSGRLSGTPAAADIGSYGGITLSVTDGTDTASLSFAIQVDSVPVVNTPPVLGGSPPASVTAGDSYQFQPTASDADGDPLSFSITNKPSWASFDAGSGRLSGTPAAADAGSYGGITLSVTDGTDTASLSFAIQVDSVPVVNTPPVLGGSPPASVTAGDSYQFQPTASDADGDPLSFSITNKPSWASFDAGSGRLSGTPAAADAGSYGGITLSVTDGTDTASLSFAIQVDPAPVVNTPPVLGGSPPASVTAGDSYQFQPTASDADGDPLSFSIANKPSWASFDAGSGRLSGTPADADAGSYGGITISVTDGTDTASLSFAIQVDPAPVQTGSLIVSWVPPATRADGSPLSLSEIDGYRVYYGTTAGTYPNSVDITDGTATSATISNLPAGPYYVVMSTYDINGLEGVQSVPVAKTAQ